MRKFREDSIPEKTKKLQNMIYKNLKGKYQTLRALFGEELASSTGDTPPCVKFKSKINTKIFSKIFQV